MFEKEITIRLKKKTCPGDEKRIFFIKERSGLKDHKRSFIVTKNGIKVPESFALNAVKYSGNIIEIVADPVEAIQLETNSLTTRIKAGAKIKKVKSI
jgi:hypothetical protein